MDRYNCAKKLSTISVQFDMGGILMHFLQGIELANFLGEITINFIPSCYISPCNKCCVIY